MLAGCCAAESDFHELPVLLAQMPIESEGWKVVNLGANTPLFSVKETMARYNPPRVSGVAQRCGTLSRQACAWRRGVRRNPRAPKVPRRPAR